MDIGNYVATGGVSGGIMIAIYMAYKCCYRKKFKSTCCGASMDVSADEKAVDDNGQPATTQPAAAPPTAPPQVIVQLQTPVAATPPAGPIDAQKIPSELHL